MTSVASQFIEGVTGHAQSDSLENAREICADGTYFPNSLRNSGLIMLLTSDLFEMFIYIHTLNVTFECM